MNILVTGSTGYLGGCIASSLRKDKSFKITTCSTSNEDNIKEKNLKINWEDNNSIKRACLGQDVIIHSASPNSIESEKTPILTYKFNSIILESLINIAIECGVKKFIYFSSIHIYSSSLQGFINEFTPLKPRHPYGISKKIAEETIIKFSKCDNIEFSIIRLANVFGKSCNMTKNHWNLVINDFCKQAVFSKKIKIKANNNETRNFVPITEIERLISFLLEKFSKNEQTPSIFNFGGKWNLNLIELAQLIAEEYYKFKGEKISILCNKNFKKQSHNFKYDFERILEAGFSCKHDYSNEILNLFQSLENK